MSGTLQILRQSEQWNQAVREVRKLEGALPLENYKKASKTCQYEQVKNQKKGLSISHSSVLSDQRSFRVFHHGFSVLIREILPVVKFEDLITAGESETSDSCAVCLYEFEGREEIRRLTNCRHIFHKSCLDRWMDHDQKTCPLCRTPFISDELQEAFNERLWAASGLEPEFRCILTLVELGWKDFTKM
ncbi:hypothetical protein NE237_011773 [Protea cynaroides]|uniref:RING-type domain-containing protein n=1 Tax=Protea cynaroides TaxID=273540 RepID=A0A9Q0GWT1_9MAGN|nr:hypothetical protein NE237_011773 [Protea cynaroides]